MALTKMRIEDCESVLDLLSAFGLADRFEKPEAPTILGDADTEALLPVCSDSSDCG